jgi:hypothetical protein
MTQVNLSDDQATKHMRDEGVSGAWLGYAEGLSRAAKCAAIRATIFGVSVTVIGVDFRSLISPAQKMIEDNRSERRLRPDRHHFRESALSQFA